MALEVSCIASFLAQSLSEELSLPPPPPRRPPSANAVPLNNVAIASTLTIPLIAFFMDLTPK
jgi:hypothetical protein